jgi:hypothetical protein
LECVQNLKKVDVDRIEEELNEFELNIGSVNLEDLSDKLEENAIKLTTFENEINERLNELLDYKTYELSSRKDDLDYGQMFGELNVKVSVYTI